MTTLLFPSQLFDPFSVEDAFQSEFDAAKRAGFGCALIDQEALDAGNDRRATRFAKIKGDAIYRGWMLTPERYAGLFDALRSRGICLLNTPEQYQHCHWLPASYERIQDHTPESRWLEADSSGQVDLKAAVAMAEEFGETPLIVKDFVKSRKHEWDDACFIPSATDQEQVRRVVGTFVERQGSDLQGGVVLRRFLELDPIGTHSQSGMPLTREHRVFVLDGKALLSARYWQDAGDETKPPFDDFSDVARTINSRFFTMDLARDTNGRWWIIELGDAQVAGLLGTVQPQAFYEAIAQARRATP